MSRWLQFEVSGLAAEVASYAVLAIFPSLAAVAAALGSLEILVGGGVAEEVRATVLGWMDTLLTDRAGGQRSGPCSRRGKGTCSRWPCSAPCGPGRGAPTP